MEILQPKLRFPEFNDNLINFKLSEKMNVFRGASPRPQGDPRYYGGNVPRVMIQDATRDGKYVFPKIDFLTELGSEKSRLLKKGSVVLSCSGTVVAIPTILGVDACIHDGWLGFDNLKDVDTEFLYYSFVKLHELMQGSATTGGVFNNLTTSIIKDYEIYFPSIKEQTKIANFLSEVDEKIKLLKEKKDLLEVYKKSIMHKIFFQKIRFKDDNGVLFEKWNKVKLKSLCEYKNGSSFEKYVSEDGKYNLISLNSIDIKGKIKETHKKVTVNDNSLSKGDLIMVLSDVAHGNFLGLTDIIPDDNYVLNQRMAALKPIKTFDSYYLKSFINFNQVYFKLKGQGSSQLNLSKSDVENFVVDLPCLKEQKKIADFLFVIDEKINLVSNQIEDTLEYKKGLLQLMFI
jgi:type I restriction enzyme S subunit